MMFGGRVAWGRAAVAASEASRARRVRRAESGMPYMLARDLYAFTTSAALPRIFTFPWSSHSA